MTSHAVRRWCVTVALLVFGVPTSARGRLDPSSGRPAEPSAPEHRSPLGRARSDSPHRSAAAASSGVTVVKQFEETSYYLHDTDFVTATVGWAVGEPHWDQAAKAYAGTIVKTDDGGETWMAQTVPVTETLGGVDFVDANNGWAEGANGAIVHTTDGGAHWIKQPVATADEFRGVVFVDANNGWATSIHPTHYNDFLGDYDNWIASLWHTPNGGATWLTQTLPMSASLLNRIDFVDAQHGWAAGAKYIGDDGFGPQHRGVIYHTDDGGVTWVEQPYGSADLEISFTGVDFVDANHGWIVGFPTVSTFEGGTTFHTTDGGSTWQRQTPGWWPTVIGDVQFIDQNRGYAVAITPTSPLVWRTMDGGTHWETILVDRDDQEGLYAVAVMGDRFIAVGDRGYVSITATPWIPYQQGDHLLISRYIDVLYHFFGVYFIDEHHGWVVGERSYLPAIWGQVILATQDGGLHWRVQYQDPPPLDELFAFHTLRAVHFVDVNHGWAVGTSKTIYGQGWEHHNALLYTSDGGQHWAEQGRELYPMYWSIGEIALDLLDIQFPDPQNGWVLASNNCADNQYACLAHTTDGGAHWNWVNTGVDGSDLVFGGGLFFSDSLHGWAVGGLENVYRTLDGGVTWAVQDPPTASDRLHDVAFINGQDGWIAGEDFFHTTNGGTEWVVESIGVGTDLTAVHFVDDLNGWAVGWSGIIVYTTDGGTTWNSAINAVTGVDLSGLSFITPQKGWLVGGTPPVPGSLRQQPGTILAVTGPSSPSPTPTPTTASTATYTPTRTPTTTPTRTVTATFTRTATVPATATVTPTASASVTPTATLTPPITMTPTASVTVTATITPAATATPTRTACAGDCGGSGEVTIDDVLAMVNIALGTAPMASCDAGDVNRDHAVTIDEILAAVHNALDGCR